MSTNEVKKTVDASSPSARFTNLVRKEYENGSNDLKLSQSQERLIQSYFVKLDSVLKENESKRLKTPEQKRDQTSFDWKNVNLEKLAQDCVALSSVGLDPAQPNHVFAIPYKNGTTGKFDIGWILGYRGIELKAMKFGLDIPLDVVVELVHENDLFQIRKKDMNNRVESYILDVKNPFDRGAVVGGFYYMRFQDETKNRVVPMSLKDIEKRKPKYASSEFWGGEKDVWKDGKKQGKEQVEGWFEEMAYKTVYRAAYNSITIDSQKITDQFVRTEQIESDTKSAIEDASFTDVTNQKAIEEKPVVFNVQFESFDQLEGKIDDVIKSVESEPVKADSVAKDKNEPEQPIAMEFPGV
jgi:recombination protein RecT